VTYTVLALESSCDEYAGAIVRDGRDLLASVVASQASIHARYGGVVPELAGREHLRSVVPVLETTLREAGADWSSIDAIAVTQGPGLGGSLLVGINAAKAIAWARDIPCIPVHHIEGHLYANWLAPALAQHNDNPPPFPLLCLVVSGGHTELLWMTDHGHFERLGQTRDDAAGEAFDKVGRLLGLPFPGGPAIEQEALKAEPGHGETFPRAWLPGTYDFSFSGVKTAVLNRLRPAGTTTIPTLAADQRARVADAFQTSVVDVLATKTARAAQEFGAASVIVAGGVAANQALRAARRERCVVPVRWPPLPLCTDNAAMIGAAAYFKRAQADPSLAFDLFSTSGPTVFSSGRR
jgi:N6-L-threonylcarbamoyladenine synthase